MKSSPRRFRRWLYVGCALIAAAGCAENVEVTARIKLATDAVERGEVSAAMLELNNLLQAEPNNRQARLLLGHVALAAGRYMQAEWQFIRAGELGVDPQEIILPLGKAMLALGDHERVLAEIPGGFPIGHSDYPVRLLHGWAHLAAGRADEAQEMFIAARKLDPGPTAPTLGLANVALGRGEIAAAERLVTATAERYPLDVAAQRMLGALRFDQRRYVEAERAFTEAIELRTPPDQVDQLMLARIGLIESQWRLGKRSLALSNCKDLLESYPWHALPKFLRALLAYESGDYHLGAELLRTVLRLVPGHRPSLQLLAAINFIQGNLGTAESHLAEYLAAEPGDDDARILLADTYLRMGNPSQAATLLEPLRDRRPDDLHVRKLLGVALLRAGEPAASVEHLRAVVEAEPDDLQLQLRLVAALINGGAIGAADPWLRQWPNQPKIERARVLLRLLRYLRSGRLERAESYAKKIRRDDPSNLIAMLVLAELAESNGNREQAQGWLEQATERNPGALEPRFLLAYYLLRAQRPGDAVDVAVEARRESPYHSDLLILLGEAYLRQGDLPAAVDALRDARRVAPDSAQARLSLAAGQLATSDFGDALRTLNDLLEDRPDWFERVTPLFIAAQKRGHLARVEELVRGLQERFDDQAGGYVLEGDLLLLRGQYQDAFEAYRHASALDTSPRSAFKAAIAGQQAGLAAATQPLERWLAGNPDETRMRRVLEAMQQLAALSSTAPQTH